MQPPLKKLKQIPKLLDSEQTKTSTETPDEYKPCIQIANSALQILHFLAVSSQEWTDSKHTQKFLFEYWLIYFCLGANFRAQKYVFANFHAFCKFVQ